MSDGNGEIPKVKTPEQEEAERIEQHEAKKKDFLDNPDRYICLHDIIVAAVRREGSVAVIINPAKRSEFLMSKSELDFRIHGVLAAMEMARMQAEQEKHRIVPARGAFGGLRKK